jgi:hypothetical protein
MEKDCSSEPSPFDGSVTVTSASCRAKKRRIEQVFRNFFIGQGDHSRLPRLTIYERARMDPEFAREVQRGEWS